MNLSIIIPHYNSVRSLKRLLDTIVMNENVQTIVVDDKSDWKTGEWEAITAGYPHVEFYQNGTDKKGAGTCRNIGLVHAVGEWILFADADDYFTDGFYEIVKEYFRSDSDIVFFMSTSIYEETGESATRHVFFADRINNYLAVPNKKNELILRYEYEGPCSRMVRRSLIADNGIVFQEVRYSNDVMFSMKTAFYAKKITADPRVLYVITQNKTSLTATINPESTITRLNVFVDKVRFLKENLSAGEFSLLNQNGMGWIMYVLKNHRNMKMLIYCIRLFRKNKVALFNYRMFTFSYWREKL